MPKFANLQIHFLIAAGLASAGQEQKLQPKDVPAAVTTAVAKQYPKAHISGWSKEFEDGQTTYEATVIDQSMKQDVVFSQDGTLIAIEQAIQISELPNEVKRTLQAKYPKATLAKAEKISRGKEIQYEVDLRKASKKEVLLSSDGKILKEE